MPKHPIDLQESPVDGPLGASYRERSLWVSLLAVALVDTLYFGLVMYRWWSGSAFSPFELGLLLMGIALVLIAIQLAFTSVNRRQREPMDERDRGIATGAASRAYAVFAGALVLALALHLANAANKQEPLFGLAIFDVPLIEVHLVLVCLVSAELVRHATALLRYRRGY